MSASKIQTLSPTPAPNPRLRGRILRMATVWAALGAVMGASVGMQGGGIIGAIAGMLAGVTELAALGAIFALIGGTPQGTLLGAVGGLLVGMTMGLMGETASAVLVADFGLVVGAIAGATLRPYLRLLALPIILLGRLLHRHQRPAFIALGHDRSHELRPFVPVISSFSGGRTSPACKTLTRSRTVRRSAGGTVSLGPLTPRAE
jgi:hypothetical protein